MDDLKVKNNISKIISDLKEKREELSFKDIEELYSVDLTSDLYKGIFQSDRIKVDRDKQTLQYLPKIPGLYKLKDIVEYVWKIDKGVYSEDLSDAYNGIEEDLEEIKNNCKKYELFIIDETTKKFYIYPDHTLQLLKENPIDEEIRTKWLGIKKMDSSDKEFIDIINKSKLIKYHYLHSNQENESEIKKGKK